MPDQARSLEAARTAFAERRWREAMAAFSELDSSAPGQLDAEDLERWSRCAWWLSMPVESVTLAERAFRAYRASGRVAEQARTALRIALLRFTAADLTVGSAWAERARRLLAEHPDAEADAQLLYLDASMALGPRQETWPAEAVASAQALASTATEPSVDALAQVMTGMAALASGAVTDGFAHLDEAMLGVVADDLEPEWAGDVLCTTIHACYRLGDFRRMADWTRATEDWCRGYGSEAVYAGVCRVHRLELRSARGDWDEVEEALAVECGDLQAASPWIAGLGWYQLGELRRQRGDRGGAEHAYARARECGIDPVPGQALLELAHGEKERAWTRITRHLSGTDTVARARLLRAAVEIGLATGHEDQAARWRDELRQIADRYDSPGFRAWADHADGMMALATGDPRRAVTALAAAVDCFRAYGQRCEQARTLAWLAAAHESAGDAAQADELRGEATAIFDSLGAQARVDVAAGAAVSIGPLTPREAEVLALVSTGASNREVAARLVLSEKTIGRHLANIYLKLDVGTRTAAAAWWLDRA